MTRPLCVLTGSGGGEYELEVEVSSLLFHHHPLFSVEHLLASKLKQTCRLLRKHRQTKTADYYQEKVRLEVGKDPLQLSSV